MKVLLLLLFATLLQAQVVDTVDVYGGTKIRIVISGDTVMMSTRQFEGLRGLIRSFEESNMSYREQVLLLQKAIEASRKIEERYRDIDKLCDKQVDMFRKEYNTLVEITANQSQAMLDMNERMFKKERKAVWRGVLIGGSAGLLSGIITGLIIRR